MVEISFNRGPAFILRVGYFPYTFLQKVGQKGTRGSVDTEEDVDTVCPRAFSAKKGEIAKTALTIDGPRNNSGLLQAIWVISHPDSERRSFVLL